MWANSCQGDHRNQNLKILTSQDDLTFGIFTNI